MQNENGILRVDLTTGRTARQPVPDVLRRKYLGGEGINAYLLWQHFLTTDPHIDPLSPDNVLIAGMGPFVGTSFGGGSKMKFTYKSPAYGIYGDTSCGGGLGPQLRWSGYDHVVITGRAPNPVYLYIHDDDIEIRDASLVWGTTSDEADDAIKRELCDDELDIACVGQAGENLVRVSSIMVNRHRAGGRGGGGCLMGSKNLKAIVARGTTGVRVHDPAQFFKATDEFVAAWNTDRATREHFMRYGTLAYTRQFHGMGFNTYRNGQGREMPDDSVDKLDHNWYRDNLGIRAYACSPGCVFACGHWHQVKGYESPLAAEYAGEWATRPEFGASNPFGAACDLPDMTAVAHINKICNQYGIDTMEVGMSISLLMELWEREIITASDVREWTGESLSLRWGNHKAMVRLVEACALQSNTLGRMIGGGVYRAAVMIGERKGLDVRKYANYGKAGATHQGAVRARPATGFACAVSTIGAHHLKGFGVNRPTSLLYFGKPDAGDLFCTSMLGAGQAVSEYLAAIANSLGLCVRLAGRDPHIVSLDLVSHALQANTGIALAGNDLFAAGERIVNLQKAFNSRLGLRREDDTLCERWTNEPQLEGKSKGMKAEDFLEAAKDQYYEYHGWDRQTSLQTRAKLAQLDMADVTAVLEKDGAVV